MRKVPVSFTTARMFKDVVRAMRNYGRGSVGHKRDQRRAVVAYLMERAARTNVMDSADLARNNID